MGSIKLAQGAIIGGVYKIETLIGKGGMGEIYLADHLNLGRRCALKVLPPDSVTENGWMRFQTEAKAVARLNHVNILQVSDLGIHEGCLPFYAMEYVEGHNLAELLSQRGPMPLPQALDIFKQICDGIEHAHRNGIIHRDLKPGNIMVDFGTGRPMVKILDFGLAKLTQGDRHQQSLTSVGDIFGSPFYMSPEQCAGERVDNRSDIYSIGCTLFECLTGRPPFTGKLSTSVLLQQQEVDAPQLSSVIGKNRLPEALELVMAKLLRKNPVERYQTAGELKGDLERIERGESVQPFYLGREVPTGHPARPRSVQLEERGRPKRPGYIWMLALGARAIGRMFVPLAFLHLSKGPDKAKNMAGNIGITSAQENTKGNASDAAKSVELGLTSLPSTMDRSAALTSKTVKAKIKPFDFDGKPFLQGLITDGGLKYRRYKFPHLDYRMYDTDNFGNFVVDYGKDKMQTTALRDQVDIAEGRYITFEPNDFVLSHPNALAGFSVGDYNMLRLVWLADYEGATANGFPQTFWTRPLDTVSMIELPEGPQEVSERIVTHVIDHFTNFRRLSLEICISPKSLAHLKCMNFIQSFRGGGLKALNEYVAVLKACPHLTQLELNTCDLKHYQFEDIAELPRLKTLSVFTYQNEPITTSQLINICKAKNLESLDLSSWHYSKAIIGQLARLKRLKWLGFCLDNTWGSGQLFELKQALPNCGISTKRLIKVDSDLPLVEQ